MRKKVNKVYWYFLNYFLNINICLLPADGEGASFSMPQNLDELKSKVTTIASGVTAKVGEAKEKCTLQ